VKRRGPPSSCTPALTERVAQFRRLGLPINQACSAAGISSWVYRDWIKKGEEKPDSVWGRFLDAMAQAKAQGMTTLILTVNKAASATQRGHCPGCNGKGCLACKDTGWVDIQTTDAVEHAKWLLVHAHGDVFVRHTAASVAATAVANAGGGGGESASAQCFIILPPEDE